MLFEAQKKTGDYHQNMDGAMLMRWVQQQLIPILEDLGVEAVLVMDNASYHCVPAPGSVRPVAWTTKKEAEAFLNKYNIEYRKGRVVGTGNTMAST